MEHIISKRCFEKPVRRHPFDIEIEKLKRQNARLDKVNVFLGEAVKIGIVLTILHAWVRMWLWILN